MKDFFEKTTIEAVALPRRPIRSATWEGIYKEGGLPTVKRTFCFHDLAAGNCWSSLATVFVTHGGDPLLGTKGVRTDKFAAAMQVFSQAAHGEATQYTFSSFKLMDRGLQRRLTKHRLAASTVKAERLREKPEGMTRKDIDEIEKAFGNASRRSDKRRRGK